MSAPLQASSPLDHTPAQSPATSNPNHNNSSSLIKDRYEIKKELGRGSYGVVELCSDLRATSDSSHQLLTVKTINVAPLYAVTGNGNNGNDGNGGNGGGNGNGTGSGSNGGASAITQKEATVAKNSLLELARKEAQVLKDVRHPGIVEYLDSFIDGENLRIVMEYCPNGGSFLLVLSGI